MIPPSHRHTWGLVTLLSIGCLLPACRRSEANAPTAGSDAVAVAAAIVSARTQYDHRRLHALVVPAAADALVALLDAVDGYVQANQRLRRYLRENVSGDLALSINQEHLWHHLGLVSRDVKILQVEPADDRATVTFTVADRVPVERATLVRTSAGWRYDPDETIDPDAAAAFERMTAGLRFLQSDLEHGKLTPGELRRNPERLHQELRLRLSDGVHLLPTPTPAPD
jgi:hypothetical protein